MAQTQRTASRVFFEVVAIVGSILLAFSIDAWWADSGKDREAQQILAGLQDEFGFQRSELTRHRDRWSGVQASIERLITATRPVDPPPVPTMDSLIYHLLSATTFDPRSGTWDALVASGRLELIESRALRRQLAAWQGVTEEVRDNELAMRDFVLLVLTPYLARRGVPLSRARAIGVPTGLVAPRDRSAWSPTLMPEEQASRVYRALLADPEFDALITTRYAWINVPEYNDAIAFVDSVLVTIEAELDR